MGASTTMVLLHVKKGEDINFLYRTPVTTSNDDATREVCNIFNLVLRIRRLKYTCDELCQFGPLKPPEKQGFIDDEEALTDTEARAKADPHFDPTGKRTNAPPTEELADVIRVRGALMIAYPMGLPDWEAARQVVEGTDELEGTSEGQDVVDPETTVMWWASKQLDRSKTLADFVGKPI